MTLHVDIDLAILHAVVFQNIGMPMPMLSHAFA
jgi:hypothetical protein